MPAAEASTNVMTWELTLARPLLLVHALAGFAALAISLHVLWFVWKGVGRNAAWRVRARRYATIAWPVYLAALVSGILIYPAYMVTVRKAGLEADRPDMVGWFEIKEHWSALGLLLVWGMWRYLRRSDMDEILTPERSAWQGQAVIALAATICILLSVIVGIWIVMIRSV